jgi:organic hydroperoxide reductase OsmC/OhrA
MSEPSISIVEQESTTGGWGCETDLDTSPQEVLVRAAATCYGATLAGLLRRSGLPARKIRISARGRFERRSGAPHLTSVALHASIAGGRGCSLPRV